MTGPGRVTEWINFGAGWASVVVVVQCIAILYTSGTRKREETLDEEDEEQEGSPQSRLCCPLTAPPHLASSPSAAPLGSSAGCSASL